MKSRIKNIIVDPRFKINYASYYLYGIELIFGKKIIKYKCIKDIDINTDRDSRVGCAFIVETEIFEKKIFIDYGDWNEVHASYYQWADVYAKINVNPDDVGLNKLMIIGPSFGLKLWNPLKSIFMGVKNYIRIKMCYKRMFNRSFFKYLLDYCYMFIRRERYSYYHNFTQNEQKGYFFSFNTLWYDMVAHETTNRLRGEFMHEAKSLMDVFEGGFYYIDSAIVSKEFPMYTTYLETYGDLISKRRISGAEYDSKTRKSWFVFNTPAVGGCHGWKLAEYLCEGKAIVSTALYNLMPERFQDGVHYMEVNNQKEMDQAILSLKDSDVLINRLKINAYNYFNKYLAPEVVIKNIIKKAGVM